MGEEAVVVNIQCGVVNSSFLSVCSIILKVNLLSMAVLVVILQLDKLGTSTSFYDNSPIQRFDYLVTRVSRSLSLSKPYDTNNSYSKFIYEYFQNLSNYSLLSCLKNLFNRQLTGGF